MKDIKPIFAVPLGIADFPEGLSEALVEAVYAVQKKGGQNYDDMLAGRMIQGEQVNLPHRHVTGVREWDSIVSKVIEFLTVESEIYVKHAFEAHRIKIKEYFGDKGIKLELMDLWATIQRAGDYNPIHTHSGFLAGTAFVKVPEQISEETLYKKIEEGNETKDFDLDGSLNFVYGTSWRPEHFNLSGSYRVTPSVGACYFFPAWLNHVVYPYTGEGDRISVAFNFRLVA